MLIVSLMVVMIYNNTKQSSINVDTAESLSVNGAAQDIRPKPKLTRYVVFASLLAGTGGLMYGYDLSVAGGVLAMEDFLMKFYPNVYLAKQSAKQNNYCKYNNQVLQLYSSSLYIAALFSTLVASRITRRHGHRRSMFIAGLFFFAGTVLGAGAQNLAMVILGRTLLGFGIGFGEQAIPLYLAEIAPWNGRGMLVMVFSMNVVSGMTMGNLVTYASSYIKGWGWRVSLGVTIVPTITLLLASIILVDTPTFLIYQKKHDKAKQALVKIRGIGNHELEFDALVSISNTKSDGKDHLMQSFRNLFQHKNIPLLVMAITLPMFQQFSGNDAILFYGPFLFKVGGLNTHSSLYSTLIARVIGILGMLLSMLIVDRVGRKIIILVGSIVMFLAMIMLGVIFSISITPESNHLTSSGRALELIALCLFVGANSASWGPLVILICSEIFPQDIRSVGQSISVFTNILVKFVVAQTLLSMMCAFKYGIFLFFAGWVFCMGSFAFFLLPETKGIPIDEMVDVWKAHWFWGWFHKPKNTITNNN